MKMSDGTMTNERPSSNNNNNNNNNNNISNNNNNNNNNNNHNNNNVSIKKTKQSQRVPMCTRCQNHGIKVAVKFHKRDCRHRYCVCEKCIFTSQRQHFMKVATAQRRARQQDEEKRLMEEAQKKAMSESSISHSNDSNSSDAAAPLMLLTGNGAGGQGTDLSCKPAPEPVFKIYRKSFPAAAPASAVVPPSLQAPSLPPPPPPPPHHVSTSPLSTMLFEAESNIDQVEVLLGYSLKLLQRFGYPWESLGLMYVILKDARADVETAMRRITIANTEIEATARYKQLRFGNYYPGCTTSALGTLGNPTYIGQAPYVGPPPTGLDLLPGNLTSHFIFDKVAGLSPDSPPEIKPTTYPDLSRGAASHFKLERVDEGSMDCKDSPASARVEHHVRVARAS